MESWFKSAEIDSIFECNTCYSALSWTSTGISVVGVHEPADEETGPTKSRHRGGSECQLLPVWHTLHHTQETGEPFIYFPLYLDPNPEVPACMQRCKAACRIDSQLLMLLALSRLTLRTFLWNVCCILGHACKFPWINFTLHCGEKISLDYWDLWATGVQQNFMSSSSIRVFKIWFGFDLASSNQRAVTCKPSVWIVIQYVDLLWILTHRNMRYSVIVALWRCGLCQAVFFPLQSLLWFISAALRCDTGAYSALAGSKWCDRNRQLLCFWGCDWDYATLFLKKRALLMVACFMKYPTRVSVREQKCSFGVHMYVRHRGAIVVKEFVWFGPLGMVEKGSHASQASAWPSQAFTITCLN